jgi:hypothetical protein
VAVATNCWLIPIPKVNPSGVTVIDAMLGAVTVRLVLCVTPAKLALIFVDPAASVVTTPVELTFAIPIAYELQATTVVRSALLPSLYVPVAVNCWLVLTGIEEAAGEMVIDFRFAAAAVTDSVAEAWAPAI